MRACEGIVRLRRNPCGPPGAGRASRPSRRRSGRPRGAALLAAALLLGGPAAAAPDAPAARSEEAAPVDEPTAFERALAEGYVTRPEDQPAGSLLGGLLALVPGFFVHGLGHFYVGEERTALELLVTEAVGVGLVAGGLLLDDGGGGSASAARRALVHAGAFLFVGSWLADILGAFKGAESFPPDSTRVDETSLGLAYRFTNNPLTPFRHHVVLRLDADLGRVFFVPLVDLEADLDERTYQLDAGVRVLRGSDPHDELAIAGRVRRVETPGYGLAFHQYEGYVRWKLDLGRFIRSLRNLYVVQRVGVGAMDLLIADDVGDVPGALDDAVFTTSYLVFESGVELNTGRDTHLAVRFVQDPTRDIPAASPQSGLLEVGLRHRYDDDLDIDVAVTGGDGWSVWMGLGFAL